MHRNLLLPLAITWLLAWPSFASSPAVPTTGKVLDADGEPVAGAEVVLSALIDEHHALQQRLEGVLEGPATARVKTDSAGRFALQSPGPGIWRLNVSAPDMATMTRRLGAAQVGADQPALTMVKAADLELVIVDAAGQPVPEAAAVAIPQPPRSAAWWPRFSGGLSDADGKLHLRVPAGEPLHVEVGKAGHGVRHLDYKEGPRLRVEFPTVGHQEVEVRDIRGQPAPGVVAIQPRSLVSLGVTNQAGKLRLSGSVGRTLQVRFWAADDQAVELKIEFPKLAARAPDQATTSDHVPPPDKPSPLKVRLQPALQVSGQVLSRSAQGVADLTKPIAGALVRDAFGRWTQADVRGSFSCRLPALGDQVWLSASAERHLTDSQRWPHATVEQDPSVHLLLAPAASLSGRVVDQHGKAVPGVAVMARHRRTSDLRNRPRRVNAAGTWASRSDRQGRFSFVTLPSEMLLSLTAERDGYARLRQPIDPLAPFEARGELVLELIAGRVGRGRVVDAEDQALAGATVKLFEEGPAGPMRTFYQVANGPSAWLAEAVTDADGTYQLDDLGAGRFSLQAEAPGHPAVTVPGLEILAAEGVIELGTVALVPGVALAGQVVDELGEPIPGAQLQLVRSARGPHRGSSAGSNLEQKTNELGEFIFPSVAYGRQVLQVGKEGFLQTSGEEIEVPPPEPLRIVLHRGLELPVRAVDSDRQPIKGAWVFSEGQFGFGAGGNGTDEEGRMLLRGLAPGSHRLLSHAKGYRQASLLVELPRLEGEERELTLVLEKGSTLSGTVRYTDGQPAPEVTVLVNSREATVTTSQANGTTDALGRFEIEGVNLGKHWVTVGFSDGDSKGREVEIRPGSNRVDLVIPAGVPIAGRVLGPAGEGLGGAQVSLRGDRFNFGAAQKATLADSEGAFVIQRVAAGRYWVDASHPDFAEGSSEAAVEVSDSPVGGVQVRLGRGTTLVGWLRGVEFDELTTVDIYLASERFNRLGRPDYEGRFTFENLGPGTYQVIAMKTAGRRLAHGSVTIEAGQTAAEIELRPLEGVALQGLVLRQGQPVPQVQVSIQISGLAAGYRSTSTNSAGRFTIEPVPEGSHQLRLYTRGNHFHNEQVQVVEGEEVVVELPIGRIAGRVVDATTGEPVSEASLRLERDQPSGEFSAADLQQMAMSSMQRTDSQGKFLLDGLRSLAYRLVVQRSGYATEQVRVDVGSGAAGELEIRLTPSEGAALLLTVEQGSLPSTVHLLTFDVAGRLLAQASHSVAGDGRVDLSSLGPGSWQVVLVAEGRAWIQAALTVPGPPTPVLLPEGSQLDVQIPELAGDAKFIGLEVTDAAGRPLGGPAAPYFRHLLRLRSGRAQVPGLSPGTWQIEAEHLDGRRWSGTVEMIAGQDKTLTLQ